MADCRSGSGNKDNNSETTVDLEMKEAFVKPQYWKGGNNMESV